MSFLETSDLLPHGDSALYARHITIISRYPVTIILGIEVDSFLWWIFCFSLSFQSSTKIWEGPCENSCWSLKQSFLQVWMTLEDFVGQLSYSLDQYPRRLWCRGATTSTRISMTVEAGNENMGNNCASALKCSNIEVY